MSRTQPDRGRTDSVARQGAADRAADKGGLVAEGRRPPKDVSLAPSSGSCWRVLRRCVCAGTVLSKDARWGRACAMCPRGTVQRWTGCVLREGDGSPWRPGSLCSAGNGAYAGVCQRRASGRTPSIRAPHARSCASDTRIQGGDTCEGRGQQGACQDPVPVA